MKSMLHLLKGESYSSLTWHESQVIAGVRFAIRRVSLSQRIDLTRRVQELANRYEFLTSGDIKDQLEATLADLLVRKLYLEWGLLDVTGLKIDGKQASLETLVEKGPEILSNEIVSTIRNELELSADERKNS